MVSIFYPLNFWQDHSHAQCYWNLSGMCVADPYWNKKPRIPSQEARKKSQGHIIVFVVCCPSSGSRKKRTSQNGLPFLIFLMMDVIWWFHCIVTFTPRQNEPRNLKHSLTQPSSWKKKAWCALDEFIPSAAVLRYVSYHSSWASAVHTGTDPRSSEITQQTEK